MLIFARQSFELDCLVKSKQFDRRELKYGDSLIFDYRSGLYSIDQLSLAANSNLDNVIFFTSKLKPFNFNQPNY